ncbi:hypothetical protein PRK78_003929 [Emydomyces testavorans]|uniref:Gamma-glutamylcyclotransferase n=1 Tax=Emydomyces testavorans TaxID=2070801 RepID=A0AAF0DJ68_9EURO|nr:hypothetical protein PRK78_003929 [Emydomyces testavorans]
MDIDEPVFSSPVCSAPTHWYSAGGDTDEPEPGWYFLYGAFKEPNALVSVLCLDDDDDDKIELYPAVAFGFKTMKWGQEPVLIRSNTMKDDAVVSGVAVKIEKATHARKLRDYQSDSFRLGMCCIRLEIGERRELVNGFILEWNGSFEELRD